MSREEIISSAVSFLQDPSVINSPLPQRIAFLRSKNLTQAEIDVALARAEQPNQTAYQSVSASSIPPPPRVASGWSGYGYGYGTGAPWMQGPIEPPRRDWRDWFIMATVTSGVSYGLYTAAKRYVLPLISPPTPPQLQQDKAAIDASFDRAFALIEQLASDTAEIKAAEAARTEKLDATIRDVESVVADLKAANTRRDAEARITADQVAGLKELVPRSLEQWKQNGDARLEELTGDLQSLKRLLENRVGANHTTSSSQHSAPNNSPPGPAPSSSSQSTLPSTSQWTALAAASKSTPSSSSSEPSSSGLTNGTSAPSSSTSHPTSSSTSTSTIPPYKRAGSHSKAAIPAWQMAASSSSSSGSNDKNEKSAEGNGHGSSG